MKTQTLCIAGVEVQLVKCPIGTYHMGSHQGLPLEMPVHQVSIEKPFWIATTLVTQELWAGVMHQSPSTFNDSITLPVDGVSYDDATAFCMLASKLSGQQLTLPTESQWEYACRAGTTTEYFWGESASDAKKYGWFDMNSKGRTQEVAKLVPNPWGLFDIVGNLWEWCADSWHSDYIDAPPTCCGRGSIGDQPRRCLRGGAWDMDVFRLRSAYRSYDHREVGTSRFGMRIALNS